MADSADDARPAPGGRYILSDEQQNQIKEWVADKSANTSGDCPVCGENAWRAEEEVVMCPVLPMPPSDRPAAVYPMFILVCSNCAYVMQFMALQAGLSLVDSDD